MNKKGRLPDYMIWAGTMIGHHANRECKLLARINRYSLGYYPISAELQNLFPYCKLIRNKLGGISV